MNESEKILIEMILKKQDEMAADIKLLLSERDKQKGAIKSIAWVIGLIASGIGAFVGKFI